MSTINQLCEILELFIVSYKRNKATVEKAVNNGSSTRTLKLKMQSLDESVNHLNSSHTSWVIKTKFHEASLSEEKYSNQWLENIRNDVDELSDKANDNIENEEKGK